MVRALLVRGLLVGLMAGVVGFGFARVVGEPQVSAAISFEDRQPSSRRPSGATMSGHGWRRTITPATPR